MPSEFCDLYRGMRLLLGSGVSEFNAWPNETWCRLYISTAVLAKIQDGSLIFCQLPYISMDRVYFHWWLYDWTSLWGLKTEDRIHDFEQVSCSPAFVKSCWPFKIACLQIPRKLIVVWLRVPMQVERLTHESLSRQWHAWSIWSQRCFKAVQIVKSLPRHVYMLNAFREHLEEYLSVWELPHLATLSSLVHSFISFC